MNFPASPLSSSEAEPVASTAAQSPTRRFGSRRAGAVAAIALVVAGALGWKLIDHEPAAAAAMPPALVSVAHPLMKQVTEWDDYVGRFAPSKTVEVRPRVSGAITQVLFRDGQIVRKGQPLFVVDPRPYKAAEAEAAANVASARSALALARSDYNRIAGLTGDEAMAASEVDQRRTRVQAAVAALAGAQAQLRERQLDVDFTTVRAPISGRISDRRVDAGNMVSGDNNASATLLTTINALDPIYFTFDASEALFLKTRRDKAEGEKPGPVEVRLQDESQYRWKGHLDFTDNGLDPNSGTIRVRAVFENPKGFLTPGMFGNMRLADGGTVPALLVPDAAIQSDQARKVVMTVSQDGTVVAKAVQLGPLVKGLRVITAGLDKGDTVIVSNYQAAIAGTKVTTKPGTIAFDPNAVSNDTDGAEQTGDPAAAQATVS